MSDDNISRQAAIDAMGIEPLAFSEYENGLHDKWESDVESLMKLPSVQPEQQWIPCSKRMPEEHEWIGTKKFGTTISDEVYVTFESHDGVRFAKHLSFQNGKLSNYDQRKIDIFYKGAVPVAWMPLPEPYNEEER